MLNQFSFFFSATYCHVNIYQPKYFGFGASDLFCTSKRKVDSIDALFSEVSKSFYINNSTIDLQMQF